MLVYFERFFPRALSEGFLLCTSSAGAELRVPPDAGGLPVGCRWVAGGLPPGCRRKAAGKPVYRNVWFCIENHCFGGPGPWSVDPSPWSLVPNS